MWGWIDVLNTSLMAQPVRNLPAMRETLVLSLDCKDPLEKGMATHSSILAWRISWTRGAWQAIVHGGQKESDMTEQLTFSLSSSTHTQALDTVWKKLEYAFAIF